MKKTCLANGRPITYYTDGAAKGLPLVLLHGFCEDSSVWDAFLPHFKNIPLVRIDLPGFGGSGLSPSTGMDSYASAVAAVLHEMEITRCVLVGHSMGGYTALAFARRYPEYLAGLGLFHSHPFEDTPDRIEGRKRGIEMLRSGKKDLYVRQLFPNLFPAAFVKDHPKMISGLIKQARQLSAEGIIAGLEAMMTRPNHLETLKSAPYPVLFVLGSEDTLVPPDLGLSAALAPAVSSVHLLPETGHMGMLEAPAETAGLVLEFWQFCKEKGSKNPS